MAGWAGAWVVSWPQLSKTGGTQVRIERDVAEDPAMQQLTGTACNLLMAGSLIAVVSVLVVAMVARRKVVEASPSARSAGRSAHGTCGRTSLVILRHRINLQH
ncbi:MAG TPA: hypothetical protein VN969_35560 [Streptosporangiaceae bacterium]|nr:hypothetical protein [Streptosporangiaceae bacterium]